jgi:hypothetical protein
MRTVTFSSEAVKKSLNEDFVCTLVNTEGDPSAGASMAHAPSDQPGPCSRGVGKQNVQCLFLTPRGEIFHAISGFVGPNDMQDELAFVLETFKAVQRSPSAAKQIVADAHAKRLKKLGFSDQEIKGQFASGPQEFFSGLPGIGAAGESPAGLANLGQVNLSGDDFDARKSDMFGFLTRGTVLHDYKFVMKYPLLPWKDFKRQPHLLVGSGKSAFVSSGSGGPSGGKIGN